MKLQHSWIFQVTQYEREKQLRKSAEVKTLEIEDVYEGERKDAQMKIESLTSIVKMFELKTKNFQDQSKSKYAGSNNFEKREEKSHRKYLWRYSAFLWLWNSITCNGAYALIGDNHLSDDNIGFTKLENCQDSVEWWPNYIRIILETKSLSLLYVRIFLDISYHMQVLFVHIFLVLLYVFVYFSNFYARFLDKELLFILPFM